MLIMRFVFLTAVLMSGLLSPTLMENFEAAAQQPDNFKILHTSDDWRFTFDGIAALVETVLEEYQAVPGKTDKSLVSVGYLTLSCKGQKRVLMLETAVFNDLAKIENLRVNIEGNIVPAYVNFDTLYLSPTSHQLKKILYHMHESSTVFINYSPDDQNYRENLYDLEDGRTVVLNLGVFRNTMQEALGRLNLVCQ